MSTSGAPDEPAAPLLQVVSGRPDHAELAALVTVLLARPSAADPPPAPVRSAWGDPAVLVRGGSAARGWRPLPGPRP